MINSFFTVLEINQFIRDVLKSGIPQAVWVCGEIQELKEKGGHLYFNLVEKDPQSHAVLARMGVSIWQNMRVQIERQAASAAQPFVLKDDIAVKLLCKIDFYPPFGQVRLIAQQIDPIYTLGQMAEDRMKLIAALRQKGILDENKKRSWPLVPLRIGLITSIDSAAYHDFIDELKKSTYAFSVCVVDSIMQGKQTEMSVVKAVSLLNKRDDVDIIVITRGGGSISDLIAFDSAAIATAISQSPKPILTGIGHEINTTITDLAACRFAKTPTATAQMLVTEVKAFLDGLEERQIHFKRVLEMQMRDHKHQLRQMAHRLQTGTKDFLKEHQYRLVRMQMFFHREPLLKCQKQRQVLDERANALKKTIRLNMQGARTKIQTYQKVVEVADPKKVLKRGFTLMRTESGELITSAKKVINQQIVVTEFKDGQISSQVIKCPK